MIIIILRTPLSLSLSLSVSEKYIKSALLPPARKEKEDFSANFMGRCIIISLKCLIELSWAEADPNQPAIITSWCWDKQK